MAYYEKFSEQEIPYGTLEKFGLTQTMVEDLPQSIMNRLLESRWTPVLPIITEDEYGEKHKAAARIKLVRKTDGSVDVCFAPYCGFTKISEKSMTFVLEDGGMLWCATEMNSRQEIDYLIDVLKNMIGGAM